MASAVGGRSSCSAVAALGGMRRGGSRALLHEKATPVKTSLLTATGSEQAARDASIRTLAFRLMPDLVQVWGPSSSALQSRNRSFG